MLFNILQGPPNMETLGESDGPVHGVTIIGAEPCSLAVAARLARRIWVNAMCINQADLDERSKQVSRVKNIYQQAFNIVIWLGEGNEPSKIQSL